MTFTISDCKTEKCWNQTFFISSYPRYVRLQNRVCQILIMTLEHVAMPFFAETSWNSAKVIVFFLEKGEKIGSWFHHIWITWWLTFFLESIYFFRFLPSPGRNRMLNLKFEVFKDSSNTIFLCLNTTSKCQNVSKIGAYLG